MGGRGSSSTTVQNNGLGSISNPVSLETNEEADVFGRKVSEDFVQGLLASGNAHDRDMFDALQTYKGAREYLILQRVARGDLSDLNQRAVEYYQKKVALLNELIRKAPALPSPVVLYRATTISGLTEGAVYRDKGFTSTSLHQGGIEQFAKSKSSTTLVITAPKGTKGVYADAVKKRQPGFSPPKEAEWLLPPNTGIRITKVYKKNGRRYADAVIVSQ